MVRRSMSKGGGTPKGHKGTSSSRRPPSQAIQATLVQQQQRLLGGSTEHNNNTKSNPASNSNNPTTSSVVVVPQALNNKQGTQQQSTQPPPPSQLPNKQAVVGKPLKDKNPQGQQHLLEGMSPSSQVASTIPPAPSSSPVPGEGEDDLVDVDELEVDVDDVDEDLEEEDEDDDLEEEDEDEDLDEDDEYDHEDGHDDLTEPCESRTPGAPSGGLTNNNSASSYNNSPNFGSSSEEDDDDEGEVDESLDRDESEDDEEEDDEDGLEPSGFLLPPDGDPCSQSIPPDAQARLEAFFEAAGFTDGKLMSDPENLRKLTLTVSSALGEASAAINRMRDSQRKSIEEGRNDSMEEGDSLLALACSSGYFELARVLLAMGASVDDRGNKGDLTPLMDAASQGHLEIVKLLISHGADVNAQSACGNSPLMYACSSGHEDIVKELLKAGARVEDNNENGHTPLMEAASSGHVNVAKILLEHGAGINTHSNEFKESALTVACYKGHLEMVRFLLDAGADQQHKTDEMHTALMEASMDGHVEVAKLLLESGAQVNMPADSFESPLTLAACGGHVELAELLISRGANIEEVNDEGYTPLMEAAREGHLAVVKCLLKAGAKINAETEETHETALTLSACGGFLDVVDTLCHHGADIEAGASTPLMEAAQEGHYQVVKYLLDRGADITRETQTGDTALSYACENGHVDVVELLVDKGADHEHQSEGGRTPLMKACRGGHVDVIKFLLQKGADVNRQTASNDHTPLSLGCAGGHISAVEVLLASGANPFHKLKDSSTMIIEAARGGHTNVIRALLDFVPCKTSELVTGVKNQLPGGKVVTKGTQNLNKGQQQQQQAVDSSKTSANQNHGKSALKKSRSVSSMIDSCALQKQVEASGNGLKPPTSSSKAPPENNMTPVPVDTQGVKNLSNVTLSDGKGMLDQDGRKKPGVVPIPSPIEASKSTSSSSAGGAPGGNRKTATPSTSATQQPGPNATGGSVCAECNKADGQPHPHGVHVKRAAMDPASGGGTAPAASTGPPLVPSQVTAATAISERPKAKANKPSARKQVQIQQSLAVQEAMRIEQQRAAAAMRQQQQQQQKSSPSSASSASSVEPVMISPGSGGPGGSSAVVQSSPVLSPSPGGASPGSVSGSITSSKNPCCGGVLGSGMMAVGGSGNNDFSINRLVAAAAGGGGHVNSSGLKLSAPPGPSPPFVQGPMVQMQVSQVSGNQSCPSSSSCPSPSASSDSISNTIGAGSATEKHFTLDAKKLMQIFTQHHLRGSAGAAKFVDCYDGINYDATTGDHLLEYTQVMGVGGPTSVSYPVAVSPGGTPLLGSTTLLPASPGNGAPGTTTTTTTTTVVVTHGNGETETIIDGEGTANAEMIFNAAAAAAAFPTLNYSLPDMQLQSYQLTAGVPVSPSNPAGLSELACLPPTSPLTATMHTTTIINSGGIVGTSTINNNNAFQPPILLPHPPGVSNPAANTFITPNQADHGTMPQRHHPPQLTKKQPGVQIVREKIVTSTGKAMSSQATQATTSGIPPTMKKQTAKRTRSFAPAGGAHGGVCSNNQKGGSHSVASTQTGNDKTIKVLDIDSATDSNGETSLTVAALQGHYEVCEFLLSRKAHIEHRDKKGCTPLILAADGGHEKVVELLLNHGADIEAQSERTKDTALSLACTKGRFEVVDLLIKRGANKEHRNVSDYTPLSLAASGGFVNIITLLLRAGAEINSRTGSKLGISPLMLAAMNGNTAAVKLLLDQGSDINAQIETNKNTALTLACFQGRHEVVQLLLERKANLEHRAKTGLTPLMEAANGGYVDVGRVLIEKGADVNAAPVPATRDTALTIAADKGHYRFVELLLQHTANVEVRNKKGCTPMWLACNGGHLDVCQGLQKHRADVDAQDNRKISCLMAAFKKGHVKVVRWIVRYVKQFPNDQEMSRYFVSLQAEPELLKRAQQCAEFIKQAKDKQALEASKNANILLEELELEKCREESKRLQAAKRREKKKKKKMEKKQQFPQNDDNDDDRDDDGDDDDDIEEESGVLDMMDNGLDDLPIQELTIGDGKKKPKGNKGNKENQAVLQHVIHQVNSKRQSKQASLVEPEVVIPEPVKNSKEEVTNNKNSKKKKNKGNAVNETSPEPQPPVPPTPSQVESTVLPHSKKSAEKENMKGNKSNLLGHGKTEKDVLKEKVKEVEEYVSANKKKDKKEDQKKKDGSGDGQSNKKEIKGNVASKGGKGDNFQQGPEPLMGLSLNHPHQLRKGAYGSDHETNATHSHGVATNANGSALMTAPTPVVVNNTTNGSSTVKPTTLPSVSSPPGVNTSTPIATSVPGAGVPGITPKPGGLGRKDDGWKEVTRSCTSSRSKKVIVPSSVISRVIGRGGCNINAIREHTGAHIEVEKQQKGALQPERTIQIKGSADATKEAHNLITTLMSEPDADIKKLIARLGPKPPSSAGSAGVVINTAGNGTTSGSASSSCAGSIAGRVTPNILNNASAFPVIGSASAPLPPIGQVMSVGSTSSTISPPTSSTAQVPVSTGVTSSTSAPVDIVNLKGSTTFNNSSNKTGGAKGSPNARNNMSVSPPMKNGSPPLKKPIVVNNSNSSSTFEIGNFSISEANAETYNNSKNSSSSYTYGKRSMVFTPSVSSSNNSNNITTTTNSSSGGASSSFAAKLNNPHQHHLDSHNLDNRDLNWDGTVRQPQQQQRTVTPTANPIGGKKTPTSVGSSYIASGSSGPSTPPPPHNAPVTNGNVPHQIPGRQQQPMGQANMDRQQQIPNVLHSMVQNFGGGVERNATKDHDVINGPVGDQSGFGNVPRNLAPGANSSQSSATAIGSNRGANSTGSDRSPSESGSSDQQQPAPLEYSPFNYQFSKTTGWYPGDLAVRDNSASGNQPLGNFGSGNLMSSLGGSTNSLNASRAMNFASVAASGIPSSSMSTTTAQMSTAAIGGVPNGPVGGLVSIGGPKVSDGRDSEIEPKAADASKAPGYRGNTTMGSPVLRMQQQPNYGLDGGFGVPGGMNMMGGYGNVGPRQQQQSGGYGISGVPSGQFQSQEMLNHQQGMNDGNHIMYQNNSGGTVGPPPPPPVVPPPTVPTNVVLSSRLNPRAPSFMAKVSPGSGQQQQQQQGHQIPPPGSNSASAFASTQQNQFNSIPQQYKTNQQQQQYGSRPVSGAMGLGNNARNVSGLGGGWTGSGYGGSMGNGNFVDDQMGAYPALVNLVAGDPSLLVTNVATMDRMQGMHDPQGMKMEERRLGRNVGAIGAERNYNKVGSGAGVGNVLGQYTLDALDGPLNQPGGNGGGVNSWAGPSPVGGLVGMYGGAPTPPATSQQGQPIHGGLGGSHGPPPGPPQGPPRGNDRIGSNVFGRRITDDLDANRMFELQQQLQYDGQSRMMNGGGVPPMMHLPNAPPPNAHMYPFGLEHMDQHNMPKLDQSWDSQMLMDEKHMSWKWGN